MLVQSPRVGGGHSLRNYNNQSWIDPGALTTDRTTILGLAFKISEDASDHYLFGIVDVDNHGTKLHMTPAGEFAVFLNEDVAYTTSGLGLVKNTWYYMELKVYVHSTAGTIELRIDGDTVLTETGVNTKTGSNDYNSEFSLGGHYMYCHADYDDLYFLDGTGSTNNDFLGIVRVVSILPNAAGDSTQFTPSVGDNYSCVNEEVTSGDTYVTSATSGNLDLYNYTDLSGITTGILGIQINTDLGLTDGTPFGLITECKSNGVTSDDSAQTVSGSWYTKKRVMQLNPDGSVAWTPTTINAAQFGIKVG